MRRWQDLPKGRRFRGGLSLAGTGRQTPVSAFLPCLGVPARLRGGGVAILRFRHSRHCGLAGSIHARMQFRERKQAPGPSSRLVFPQAGQGGPALCAWLAWRAARKSEPLQLERLSRDWKLYLAGVLFKRLIFPKLIRGLLCKSQQVCILNRITYLNFVIS